MPEDVSRWVIEFVGCGEAGPECHAARFRVALDGGQPASVEVRVTAQTEHLLARELGRDALTPGEREAVLQAAGRRLIEERLSREGKVDPVLLVTAQLFRSRGAERRLLRECGLL